MAEEQRLIDVIKEVCASNGHVSESGEEEEEDRILPATVSWHDIARSVMTRTAMQCRQKWVMSLSWKSKGSTQVWGVFDAIKLLEELGAMADVASEDEVDWVGLSRKWSGDWTHYYLRERWGKMRRDVPNYRVKSFQGNILSCKNLLKLFFLLPLTPQTLWITSSHTSFQPSMSKAQNLNRHPLPP